MTLRSESTSSDEYSNLRGGLDVVTLPETPFGNISIARDNVVEGIINYINDVDYFRLNLQSGVTYKISMASTSRDGYHGLNDPHIEIRDNSGVIVAENDDYPTAIRRLDAAYDFTPTYSGVFFLKAYAHNNSGTGRYSVLCERRTSSSSSTPSTPSTPSTSDDYPSGSTGSLSSGGSVTGNIESAGDSDRFSIYLNAGSAYTFNLQGNATSNGTLGDPHIYVYDGSGREVAQNDDNGTNLDSRCTLTPSASGLYYVDARSHNTSGTGTYRLSASSSSSSTPSTPSTPSTSDDYPSGSTGSLLSGGSVTGNIESAGDSDRFSIYLNAGSAYTFNLQGNATSNGTLGDPHIYVYDGSGREIAQNDDNGTNLDSRCTLTPSASGLYYVDARSHNTSGTGTYRLSASSSSSSTPSTPSTPSTSDDYPSGSTGSLSSGGSVTGSIESAGDSDRFSIYLNAGAAYTFNLQGNATSNGTLGDPHIYVYDGSGREVAQNDDNGTNLDSRCTLTPSASGLYYVDARSHNTSGTGTYRLSASAPSNSAPVRDAGLTNQTAQELQSFRYQFPENAFRDPDGNPLSYSASGMPDWMSFDSSNRTFSGTPSRNSGDATIQVTASDGRGGALPLEFSVTTPAPANTAPIRDAGLTNQSAQELQSFRYQFPENAFRDPDGNPLSYSASGMPGWMSFDSSNRTFTGTPPRGSGDATIRVTADDGRGGTLPLEFSVATPAAPNSAPVRDAGLTNQSAQELQRFSYQVPANAFRDPDGDTLSYSASGLPGWMSFDASSRTFSGTPTRGSDDATVRVTADDGRGGTLPLEFTITTPAPANTAPVRDAGLTNQSAQELQRFNYQVPANAFRDADGDRLSYSASGMPGWMSFDASNRTFSGTPTRGSDDATVRVTADDGRGGTLPLEFSVTTPAPGNTAPVRDAGLTNQSAQEGQSFRYQFASTAFRDPDGDRLTYSVSDLPSWLSFDPESRAFSGTPPQGASDPVLRVTATDPGGLSVADSFTITTPAAVVIPTPPAPINHPPVVRVSLDDQLVETGANWRFIVPTMAFSDPDNDRLTYSARLENGRPLPSWLRFVPSTRVFTGRAPAAELELSVQVTANDRRGGTASQVFTLTVEEPEANHPPEVGTELPDQTVRPNSNWRFTMPAGAFIDPDGDRMTYRATLESGARLPTWLQFNATSRTFTGRVPRAFAALEIRVTATDSSGEATSQSFSLSQSTAGRMAQTLSTAPVGLSASGTALGSSATSNHSATTLVAAPV